MIKSNLGSGYVRNVVFDSFISRDTAYGLDINQYWASQSPGTGAGVQLSNITFSVGYLPFSYAKNFSQPYGLYRTGTETSPMAFFARPCSSSVRTAHLVTPSLSTT